MIAAARSAIASRKTSLGCTSDEFRIPRVTVTSRSSRCWESSTATWNSSTGRSSSRGAKAAKTSRGERTGMPSSRPSAASRRPSSSAACSATARACPTPGTSVSAATGAAAMRRSDPAPRAYTSCATSSADRPPAPLPTTIASSSVVLSAVAPCRVSRSRGRSAGGSSRMLSAPRRAARRSDGAGEGMAVVTDGSGRGPRSDT